MKIYSLFLALAFAFSSIAFADGHKGKKKEERFKQRMEKRAGIIDKRIESLKTKKECLLASKTQKEAEVCRKAHKDRVRPLSAPQKEE